VTSRLRLTLASILALAALGAVAPAAQATTLGPPVQISTFSPARDDNPAGKFHADAVNPKTGAQIAFYVANGGGDDYYATQLFTADGPVGSENVVVSGGGFYTGCWQPSIAYNPATGGWFAAYPDDSGNRIVGQLLNADGTNSGAPFTAGSITNPNCAGLKINWNSKSKKFLLTFTSENSDDMKARFISGSGIPQGTTFTALENVTNSYCAMDTAYSSKSNTFLASVGAECVSDATHRPLVQFLSGAGDRVGSARYLGDTGGIYNYSSSIAYNAKLDEFGVFWLRRIQGYPQPLVSVLYLQRIDASTGANVGSPIEITPPDGFIARSSRPRVSASPSGRYYISTFLVPDPSSNDVQWYSFKASGTGTTVADSLEDVSNGLFRGVRLQNLYNPVTGQFLSTFVASTVDSYPGQSNLYVNGGPGSPPTPGSKPTLTAKGSPGATSLQVKVGCGGGGSCRIQLGGKLVGGSASDKLVGKTVEINSAGAAGAGTSTRAKASRTVTLAYTGALIRQLAADGGGKIRVKARQVGGKSKTITVTVPASVTG
jgi:hypothetical protein